MKLESVVISSDVVFTGVHDRLSGNFTGADIELLLSGGFTLETMNYRDDLVESCIEDVIGL